VILLVAARMLSAVEILPVLLRFFLYLVGCFPQIVNCGTVLYLIGLQVNFT
jgi:hypothetical protein